MGESVVGEFACGVRIVENVENFNFNMKLSNIFIFSLKECFIIL